MKCDKQKLKECKIILVKLNKKNELINCEPCHMCQKIISKYKISKVISYYQV